MNNKNAYISIHSTAASMVTVDRADTSAYCTWSYVLSNTASTASSVASLFSTSLHTALVA